MAELGIAEAVSAPLAGDRWLADASVASPPENRSSGRSAAPGGVERLASWLTDACARGGVQLIPRREAQRFGPIREPTAFESALTALADLHRVELVSEGKRRLIRLTLAASVDVGAPAAPTAAGPSVATVAGRDAASVASVATGPAVAPSVATCSTTSVSTGSVATVADLSEADREWFEERAAILEFDGGMERAQAEAEARRLLTLAAGRRAG